MLALESRVGANNELNNPVWVDKKLPPKYLKKSVFMNGINEYQNAPPNKMFKLYAKINVINEIEIAAV